MSSFWNDVQIDIEANTGQPANAFNTLRHILFHPSVRVLFNYRLVRKFGGRGLLARHFWASNCFKSGCFLSPYSNIEPGVILVHASGIVVGEGATIKKGVRIFQHVTVGTRNWKQNETETVIEEGAVLYTGSVIAGAKRIGKNAVIPANSVVLDDVPDKA